MYADCTCPYLDSHGDYCKHIWATLLKIDRRTELARVPAVAQLRLLYDGIAEPEPTPSAATLKILNRLPGSLRDSLIQSGLTASVSAAGRTPARAAATRKKPVKPKRPAVQPAWSKVFEALARHSALYPPPRKTTKPIPALDYVLDLDIRAACESLCVSFACLSQTHWRGYSTVSISPSDFARLEQELDRRICLMIVGGAHASYDYSMKSQGKWTINDAIRDELMPLLFETCRVYLERSSGVGVEPLTWDPGEPYRFGLALKPDGKKKNYRFEGVLRRGDDCLPLDGLRAIGGDPALVVHNGTLSRATLHDCTAWWSVLRDRNGVGVAESDRRAFLEALARSQPLPPVDWPPGWNIKTIEDVSLRPRLELVIDDPDPRTGKPAKWVAGTVKFVYDDIEVVAARNGSTLIDPERNRQVRRRVEEENRLAARVKELGMSPIGEDGLRIAQKQLPSFVAALLDEGWEVLGNRLLFRTSGEFKLEASAGIDWFDLNGYLDFDGQQAPLPALLAAIRKGERFVPLCDGSMGVLPAEWLAKHERLLGLGEVEGDSLRFKKTQLNVVDILLSQMPEVRFDRQIAAARAKLREFEGVLPRTPAVEAQAIDRTHRIGQDKKVIAYRLITRDTVESKIVQLQQQKRELAGAIINQANSMLQDLTREDLAQLLS